MKFPRNFLVNQKKTRSDEIRMAVEEAARRGRHVMAHAHSADGILQAISVIFFFFLKLKKFNLNFFFCSRPLQCGCKSIEHASFIDERGIQLIKEKEIKENTKIFLVPTLFISEHFRKTADVSGPLAKMIELEKV